MGGIGKTTLAAVYVDEFYEAYDHIVWLTIDNSLEEAVATNYALIENLGLKHLPAEEHLEACLNALRIMAGNKPGLLILDNAGENLAQFYDKLPKPPGWHLLVTSRERIHRFPVMDLDFLNEDEAITLFEKYNQNFSTEQMRSIVNNVERHTLTIEILAKSARRNKWSFEKIQNALRRDARANIRVLHSPDKIERIKSYLSSLFDLSNLDEQEMYILKQFTALPNEFIAYDFLISLLQVEHLAWQDEFAGSLEGLYEKGFILKDTNRERYKMHPVLMEALSAKLDITSQTLHLLMASVTALLKLDQTKDNPIDKFQYIPFGDALLRQIPDDTSSEKAVLQNNLALRYKDLGEYEKARDLLEAALDSDLANFGGKHPNVAAHRSNLALVYQGLGDYAKARDLLEAALGSDLESFGAKHPNVAAGQSCLATMYLELGDYAKARDLWRKAYAIFLAALGEGHPHTKTVRKFLDDIADKFSD